MIRLGLVGCGEHSESGHAIPLGKYTGKHAGEIVLAAACDLQFARAQRFCGQYGFQRPYDNVDEMLSREELDGCIAVVPAEKISEVGIKLLRRHIPCVVEKPLGSTLAEVKALCEIADSSRTPNMVSVNRRFMPFLNRALDWIRGIGPVRHIGCTMARHGRSEPEFIWATAVHAVDALRYMAGEVNAFEYRPMNTATGTTAWYGIDLHFQSGIEGRIDVLPTTGMVEETYDLFGEGFRVSVTCPFGRRRGWVAYRDGVVIAEEVAASDIPEDVVNGCYDEASAFIGALRRGSFPRPSIVEVAPSVELCMSIAKMGTLKTA